jgi:hypothetical protein
MEAQFAPMVFPFNALYPVHIQQKQIQCQEQESE